MLERLPLGIVYQNARGEITAANPAAERILGLTLDQMRGARSVDACWEARHEDGTPFPGEAHPAMEALRTGEPVRDMVMDVRNAGRDERVWIKVSAFPNRDDIDGSILGVYAVFEDISAQNQALEEKAASEARFQAVFSAMAEGMALHELVYDGAGRPEDYRILDVNPAFAAQTGLARESVVGQLASAAYGTDSAPFLDRYTRVAQTGQPQVFERYFAPLRRHFRIRVFSPGPGLFATVFEDVTERKAAEEQIRQLAFYDPLTGLPNRRLLEERLATALAHRRRQGGCLGVIALDLDHLKAINDALGHGVGDALLAEVARRMVACVRASDTVARLGGDEFMLLLPGVNADGAAHLAAKLVACLAEPMQLDGRALAVTASLGISLSPRDGATASELIDRADTAMYRAKQGGRNRYQFFTEDMQREALRMMAMEHQLRQALGEGGLCLHYQPQIALDDGRPVGLEALVRWRHPTRGLLDADQFVPLAETSGLIFDLDTWVLGAVGRQLRDWARAGLPLLPVAVNLSAQQFRHRARRAVLSAQVRALLAESGLSPALLELETTENSLLGEADEALTALQELRALGVRLALDDFGTGYSSLSRLNAFPVDRLKIDQSFVHAAPDHAKQAAIIDTILTLGRHLELEVVAEGVETAAQLEQLRRQGCRQAQGYYFSRPLAAEALEPWLRRAAGETSRCSHE